MREVACSLAFLLASVDALACATVARAAVGWLGEECGFDEDTSRAVGGLFGVASAVHGSIAWLLGCALILG